MSGKCEGARVAVLDDVEHIEDIRARHLQSIAGQRGAELLVDREIGSLPPLTADHANFLNDEYLIIVGTYDSVVFGYAFAFVETLASDRSIGRLTEFVVDEEIRKSGIGESMMDLIVEILQERGCIGVDCQALPGDRDTKNFFESFGLKARLITVHRTF